MDGNKTRQNNCSAGVEPEVMETVGACWEEEGKNRVVGTLGTVVQAERKQAKRS